MRPAALHGDPGRFRGMSRGLGAVRKADSVRLNVKSVLSRINQTGRGRVLMAPKSYGAGLIWIGRYCGRVRMHWLLASLRRPVPPARWHCSPREKLQTLRTASNLTPGVSSSCPPATNPQRGDLGHLGDSPGALGSGLLLGSESDARRRRFAALLPPHQDRSLPGGARQRSAVPRFRSCWPERSGRLREVTFCCTPGLLCTGQAEAGSWLARSAAGLRALALEVVLGAAADPDD